MEPTERNRRRLMGAAFAIVTFLLDQLSKWFVLKHMMASVYRATVTPFLNIILVWNRGISFGLLSGDTPYNRWILATIAFAFAVLLMLWIWKAETKTMACAFGFVLGGAIGNLLDRIRFGAVTDFLDFHVYGYHWYTFNIADAAIVGGVGLILLESLKETRGFKGPDNL